MSEQATREGGVTVEGGVIGKWVCSGGIGMEGKVRDSLGEGQ